MEAPTPTTITLHDWPPEYRNYAYISRLLDELWAISEIVQDGRLYDQIAGYVGIERERAKQQFFHFAYGRAYYKNHCRAWFECKAPLVAALIRDIKNEQGYSSLARAMQRAESQFMFGQVVPAIQAKLGTRLLTKHDSVLLPEDFAEPARAIFDEEFARLGFRGTVKIERP